MVIFFKSDRISINSAKDGVETLELSNGKLNHNRTFFLMEDTYNKLRDETSLNVGTDEVIQNNLKSANLFMNQFKESSDVNLEILANFITASKNILNIK